MKNLPVKARIYLLTVWSVAAVLVCLVLLRSSQLFGQLPLLTICLVMFSFADYFEVEFEAGNGNHAIMTVTDGVMMFLIAIGGGAGVLVVVFGTLIVDLIRRRAWFRSLFNIAARSITFIVMWLIYQQLHVAGDLPFSGLRGLGSFVAVASIDYIGSVFFVATVVALAREQPLLHVYRESTRQVNWIYLVTMPVGAVVAYLWESNRWLALLGVIPLVMAQRSYQALAAWQQENRRNKALAVKLERLQDTTTAMIASLEPVPLLETVSSRLAALMDAPASWVVLLDSHPPRLVASHGIATDLNWDASAYVAELEHRDLRQLDASHFSRLHRLEALPWQSVVIIPLMLDQHVLGGICLALERPGALAEDDRRVLLGFAGQAALAMERARLFAELRDKQNELVRSSKLAALGTFSAGIAHEFNNLLAGILGHAELGLMTDDQAEKDYALNVAVRTCMRGKSITRGLLTFARRNDPQRDFNQIREAVEDTLALVERELEKQNIRIERHMEPVPLTICDLGQMSQVVLNLITNARDAMAENGGGVITIKLFQQARQIKLAISDTGSGISPELLEQVFQPFVTTKGALGGSTTPGTGLGLAITYGIVEGHGGTITVESELGYGTTMTVCLPIIAPIVNEALPAASALLQPMRILIVDDDQAVADSLSQLLAQHGHEVAIARNGSDGLLLYRKQPFQIVLTDAIMPGMNGAMFVEQLRAFDGQARILVMTGQPGAPQVESMLRLGAFGVVIKPFVIDELLASIERGSVGHALAA